MENMENEVTKQKTENGIETVEKGIESTDQESVEQSENQEPETEKEPELWLEETDAHTSEVMPVATHIKAKAKLKGKITERDTEIATLKAELEALESQGFDRHAAIKPSVIKPPQEWEYESDEAYYQALSDYNQKVITENVESALERRLREDRESKSKAALTEAVESHFERASKLIQESGISPELYQAADSKLRTAAETIAPGRGDMVVDQLISVVGEGSEKVAFYVGNNENARSKFQSLLISDPSGLKAAMFLGEQKARLTGQTITKRVSKAPDPAPNATNGKAGNIASTDFKRQYEAAKDPQSMFDIKRKARLSGVDTSKW